MKCAYCDNKECTSGKDCTGKARDVKGLYKDEVLDIARIASRTEARYYMKEPRIVEIIEFAKAMGYKKIGIAFCIGLSREAETVHSILKQHFEVYSVCCKVCGIAKKDFNFETITDNPEEVMCNPAGQAAMLNDKGTDLNLIVGLCIGHDIVFTKVSEAPVSTLVVKDRVLAHNPCGAIYSRYYLRRLGPDLVKD
ncbi:MAG: DUF1847 domain-containing protein [bacterium]|jgi:uncharacterized metal-binding protein